MEMMSSGVDLEEDHVMSEVHLGCPPNFFGPYNSHFTFSVPLHKVVDFMVGRDADEELNSTCPSVSLDDDGDLILTRCSKPSKNSFVMTIQHNITSTIPSVGLQVWRAELVLADFVLHKMFTSSQFDGIVAVELGAGTGLVGMLLAHAAKTVFLTDYGDEVLENCATNVHLNRGIFNCKACTYVRELDWKAHWPPQPVENPTSTKWSNWSAAEVEELQRASLLVAADVIYSDDLTDTFFGTIERLMSQCTEKVLYLALEKRYNFTLDDLNVVANGYSRFRSYFRVEEDIRNGSTPTPCFVGTCIDLTQIPQYVEEYNRGEDVELWEIRLRTTK